MLSAVTWPEPGLAAQTWLSSKRCIKAYHYISQTFSCDIYRSSVNRRHDESNIYQENICLACYSYMCDEKRAVSILRSKCRDPVIEASYWPKVIT